METVLLPRPTQPLHIVNQPIIKEDCPLTAAVQRELAFCGYTELTFSTIAAELILWLLRNERVNDADMFRFRR